MEEFEKKLNKIFGIYYIAPHASPDGVHFDEPRCGDCFCTIQEVHTHASQKELKQRDKVLELIINTIDEIKDIMYKMPAVNIIHSMFALF